MPKNPARAASPAAPAPVYPAPVAALGIDIGKAGLHCCIPVPGEEVRRWPVVELAYTSPDWHRQLLALIEDDAVVAFEPTGTHLSAPVVSVLSQFSDARIWLVGHGTTGQVRNTHVATAKTDRTDAQALALVATWIAAGQPPRSARQHNLELEQIVMNLRYLVNERRRLMKTRTRCLNRLHAYAHAMHPALDLKFNVWLPLAQSGVITPREVHAHVAAFPEVRDRRKTRYVQALAALLPDLDAPDFARTNIARTIRELDLTDLRLLELEADIRQLVMIPPFEEVTRRVLTIPDSGGDPLNVAPFHVAAHGLLAVMTPDEFKSAVGISAQSDTSGSIDRTRAKKGGYAPAQEALYTWTMKLVSPKSGDLDNPVRLYYDRVQTAGKWKPFRAARAKLAALISGVARSPEGYAPAGKTLITKQIDVTALEAQWQEEPEYVTEERFFQPCPRCTRDMTFHWPQGLISPRVWVCFECSQQYDFKTLTPIPTVPGDPEFDALAFPPGSPEHAAALRELGVEDGDQ